MPKDCRKQRQPTFIWYYGTADSAITHATLTQLTVPHLETKEEPNFVTLVVQKSYIPSEEKLYRIVQLQNNQEVGGGDLGAENSSNIYMYIYNVVIFNR